jgi:hypothetical protein
MDGNSLLEIIKIVFTFLTPIIVLIFGIIISRKVEDIKNQSSKKRDWQTQWSQNFLKTFQELNFTIEEILYSLFRLSELSKPDKYNSDEEAELIKYLNKLTIDLERKEFGMRTQLCFAPQSQKDIGELINRLFQQIRAVYTSKKGDMDDIHDTVKELNKKAKLAHSEILGLS